MGDTGGRGMLGPDILVYKPPFMALQRVVHPVPGVCNGWARAWAWVLAYLLRSPLVGPLVLVVNSAEVGDNDRNGQSNDQHPAQGANGAKYLPGNCLGHHVTITRGERTKKGKPLLQTSVVAPKACSGSLSEQQRGCPGETIKQKPAIQATRPVDLHHVLAMDWATPKKGALAAECLCQPRQRLSMLNSCPHSFSTYLSMSMSSNKVCLRVRLLVTSSCIFIPLYRGANEDWLMLVFKDAAVSSPSMHSEIRGAIKSAFGNEWILRNESSWKMLRQTSAPRLTQQSFH